MAAFLSPIRILVLLLLAATGQGAVQQVPLAESANIRPMNLFCCGCTLSFGVRLILLLHLAQNLFCLVCATSNILLQIPLFGSGVNLAAQTFNAGFSLAGLPFIFAAWLGVRFRMEPHLRLYLAYQVLSVSLDLAYVLIGIKNGCASLPAVLQQNGEAFACGAMRFFFMVFTLMLTSFQFYFIFTVWSLCEDLKTSGCGDNLHDLFDHFDAKKKHKTSEDAFWNHRETYPGTYGGTAPGMGGSSHIFGKGHDVTYPPLA